jgi:NAD-dependent SIR2 family protein deacetylase
MQERLLALNPDWRACVRTLRDDGAAATPDGDAAVPEAIAASFRVPGCEHCGGVLKPDVVFFGENVPAATVEVAWAMFEEAEAVLVVGSSLTVYSGRRFVDRAHREGRPVAIVNLGPTRSDEHAAVRVEGKVGAVLPRLAARLASQP